MKKLFKNIFPGLFLFWLLYLVEWGFISIDLPFRETYNSLFYLQNLYILTTYTLFGISIGCISSGILSQKRVRYYSILDPNREPYYKHFSKNIVTSLLIVIIILLREIINQPALFKETYLNQDFFLFPVFNFVAVNFSPLYFSTFLVITTCIFFYKIIKTYTFRDGLLKLCTYLMSSAFLLLLLFNYGFLNASKTNSSRKNLIIIGVEDFKKKFLTKRYADKLPALSSLKNSSYNFNSCYTVSTEMIPSIISTIYSLHPENGGIKYSRQLTARNRITTPSFFSLLQEKGYNTMAAGDGSFYSLKENFDIERLVIPDRNRNTTVKTAVMRNHPLSFLFANNFLALKIFPEILSLEQYQEKGFYQNKINALIKDKEHNFAALYLLSKSIDNLPFPFARAGKREGELSYAGFIDEGVGIIMDNLKREGRFENTLIVFFGIPGKNKGIRATDIKIPLLISSPEYKKERKIKNNYTNLDILPSTYQIVTGDSLKLEKDGKSLFDIFEQQDIFVSDNLDNTLQKFDKSAADDWLIKTGSGEFIDSDREPLISALTNRAYIRGNYKLNILPKNGGITYQLFDLKNDPLEKTDILQESKRIADKMIHRYEKGFSKKSGYNFINGYSIQK